MSVLRYPGGKTRAVKFILPYIPDNCKVLYSPFLGGGSIEITCAKRPEIEKIVANDKFSILINFWKVAQSNPTTLIDRLLELHKSTITKSKLKEFREKVSTCTDDIEKAKIYFAINRCSFSGATFSGGFSNESMVGRFTQSSINKIKTLDLSKFQFSCKDAIDFLEIIQDNPDHYIYADPPYLLEKGNKLYGDKGDLHENFDHEKFRNEIIKQKRWIISYNDTSSIRKLYSGYRIVPLEWKYGMNASKKSSEILIVSADIVLPSTT